MHKIKLSPYSRIFYNEWLLNPDSYYYNIVIDHTLYGDLDIDRLKIAFKRYINDYVLLNSHILSTNGEPYWVKNNDIYELEYFSNAISIDKVSLLQYVTKSFDLHNGPLYRFKLFHVGNDVYRLILVFHHILVNGTSSGDVGIFQALSNYYNNENYISKYSTEEQIKIITELSNTLFAKLKQNQDEHKKFWRDNLIGVENVDLKFLKVEKNIDKIDFIKSSNQIEEIKFSYGETESKKLGKIKHKYLVTPYSYGRCILAMLINRYTNQELFAISYPVAIKEGMDFVYGSQLNTNIIPYQFKSNTTIMDLFRNNRQFLKSLKQKNINHSYYPITDVVQESGKNLLNTGFIQTQIGSATFEFNKITKIEISTDLHIYSVPKDMLLFEQEINELNYRVRYDKRSFDKELIDNFIGAYKKLFLEVLDDLIIDNDSKQVNSYDILTLTQYKQTINKWNQSKPEYICNKTIHELFEEQVLKTPHSIALVCGNVKLTYLELNSKANQLANYLVYNYDIKADDLIALYLTRTEYMLVAILAILKTGGAYVPLDLNHPVSRIEYILKDAEVKLVLVNTINFNNLKLINHEQKYDMLAVDDESLLLKLKTQSVSKPQIMVSDINLVYVIYTSGTTGKPNGVMIEHRNAVNYIFSMYKKYSDIKYIDFSGNIAFDLTITTTLMPLITGKTIFIYSGSVHDIFQYAEHINTNCIELIKATPSFLSQIPSQLFSRPIKICIVGGEKLTPKTAKYILKFSDQVVDEYGPTETTVGATEYWITNKSDSYNIGKPYINYFLYILDYNLSPLPIGAIGEIYIGGNSLARGYLNNASLTAERFILNPFQTTEEKQKNQNTRLYKTGDFARILPDGNLEYIGRNDAQVKINGYRIELNEIENKLIEYPEIKQAAVLVATDENLHYSNHECLVAYYVSNKKLDKIKIRKYLAMYLPEYMLPKEFVYLAKMPLTVNGKLDKKTLIKYRCTDSISKYEAPNNKQERLICKAFSIILGMEKIGINDDFFELGGSSVQAIKLLTILHTNFDIKMADIFNLRTPRRLSKCYCFSNGILKQKLELMKLLYQDFNKTYIHESSLLIGMDHYFKNINNLSVNHSLQKPIVNVLLTGATGYLGCNIFRQLLELTNYNIFILVRAGSQEEAVARVNEKFNFYFNKTLDHTYNSRISIIQADIEKKYLGVSQAEYQIFINKIDSVIHSAALVKHYGDYDKFYLANVQATINLLELVKLTKLKDFHYISTCSVLKYSDVSCDNNHIYTEDCLPNSLNQYDNVYVQTKLQGEQEVIKYRKQGVFGNIYRVGNLAFMTENCRLQFNIEDNAFFIWLRDLLKIKCIARDISVVEISPTDLTAKALVKLFDKQALSNNVYHVFNPYSFDISDFFTKNKVLPIKLLTIEQFIDSIIQKLKNNKYHDLIVRFLLHQGWLNHCNKEKINRVKILQNKTQQILRQLGFEWTPITKELFEKYINFIGDQANEKSSKNI